MTEQELVALLRSSQDFVPLPETWSGSLQRRSVTPGPAPFHFIECPNCEGRGKLRTGWTCRDCKGLGRYEVDAYTEEPVGTDATAWEDLLRVSTVNCWKCGGWGRLGAHAETRPSKDAPLCPECDGSGKEPAALAPRVPDVDERRARHGDRALDSLESQHERRDDVRAYRELAAAMDSLKLERPGTHFLICWIYVLEVQAPSPANAAALMAGLEFLLARLGDVRAPRFISGQVALRQAALVRAKGKSADRKAQAARNAEIRRRRDEGAKLRELAADFDLDKGQVSRILRAP